MKNEFQIKGDVVHIVIGGRGKSKVTHAVINKNDLPKVEKYRRWVVTGGRCGKEYIVGYRDGEKPKQLHRVIANTPVGSYCNFKNGDGLDCRRENLVNGKRSRPLVRKGTKLTDKYITQKPIKNVKGRYRYCVMVTEGKTKKWVGTYFLKADAIRARDAFFKALETGK